MIHLFGAGGLTHVGNKLDVGEHLVTFEAKLGDAMEWIRQGIITDTKTIIGIMWWAAWGKGRPQRY